MTLLMVFETLNCTYLQSTTLIDLHGTIKEQSKGKKQQLHLSIANNISLNDAESS